MLNTIISSLRELLGSMVKIIPAILAGLIVIMITRYVAQFLRDFSEQVAKRACESQSLQSLVAKVTYVTTWIVGILLACVLAFPGLRLGDLIAALGLSSVAVGFAFQDIFKNFLSGILILIQQPFRIDDQIIVGDYEGIVERIDIRTTKIRTYNGERVLVPNSEVFTSAVQVRTAYENRRTDLAVGVDYNTSLPKAKKILQNIITGVEGVLNYPEPEIDLVAFGDSSIDLIVRYWTTPRQPTVRQVQTRAIIAIKQAFDEADISIPYPIRTVYHYDQQEFNDYLPSETNESKEYTNNGRYRELVR